MQHQAHDGPGLTLAELQQIGATAGIDPDYIARAAQAIERLAPAPALPSGACPSAYHGRLHYLHPLPMKPGGAWSRTYVRHFRCTVRCGKMVRFVKGNGNLKALFEPPEDGERFRLETLNQKY